MIGLVVPFYFGLGSRYSYLAASQLDHIEADTGCRFEWLPLQSGALIRRANDGRTPFHGEPVSGQYNWSYRQRDAEAWARYYGIPYVEPAEFRVDPADLARACWAADGAGKRVAMSRRVFQAIFVENRIVTRDVLGDCAAAIGLDAAALVAALDTPAVAALHDAALDRALADGVFGVPSFVVDGALFWGNDRLPLVWHALGGG